MNLGSDCCALAQLENVRKRQMVSDSEDLAQELDAKTPAPGPPLPRARRKHQRILQRSAVLLLVLLHAFGWAVRCCEACCKPASAFMMQTARSSTLGCMGVRLIVDKNAACVRHRDADPQMKQVRIMPNQTFEQRLFHTLCSPL